MEAVETRGWRWLALRRHIVEWFKSMALALVLAILLRALVLEGFWIPSGSMRPTLQPGDYILVNRLVYRIHPPRLGDVIVFRYPRDEHWEFVKRVIAGPGDVVEERDGHFWVDGSRLRQPFASSAAGRGSPGPTVNFGKIPPDKFFVLGDNRGNSLDSRFWGTVDAREVIGEAFVIYWSRGEHWWNVRWNRIGHWIR